MTDLPATPNPQPSSATRGAGAGAPTGARLRGAVDLSGLNPSGGSSPQARQAGAEGWGAGAAASAIAGFAIDVTEQTFPEIVQLSTEVPVVVAMHAAFSPQSRAMVGTMERLTEALNGRILLARADIEAFPQLAQAFGVQGVPAVVALLKSQPVPLFNGELSEAEASQYLDELLRIAEANGVSGTLPAGAAPVGAEPAEPELPPLHQEAVDAIDRGDLAAAVAAYRKAIAQSPGDSEAKAGLAQVCLMQRTDAMDAAQVDAVRTQAAEQPDDLEAQLAVADIDLLGGHVEDALNRVVGFIAAHPAAPDQREQARVRVLELFEVVGLSDPRVAKARQALARALF
ncbi:tetratricopeptide repeat protein [Acaricomes phytoseiuli]|uniref:tetratricopeptide repeat protein n=1 Tax=Acaricomes phytoseiuli TaxID=291968 RepID=UPI0003679B94|nr:tetratricopeptide repeat protein [Acaricomes phytoseiuli]MCW1248738.1 tetratricopeptide repeat protein [Acaricomes phytoseiuli]